MGLFLELFLVGVVGFLVLVSAFSLEASLSSSLSVTAAASVVVGFEGLLAEDGQNQVPERNLPTDARNPVGSSACFDDPSFSFLRFFPGWVAGGASFTFLEALAVLERVFILISLDLVAVSTHMVESSRVNWSMGMDRRQSKEK